MANPISPNPTAALPPFSLTMVDLVTGTPSFVWYQFFLSLYSKSGGQQGLDLSTVKAIADQALQVANEADEIAASASQTATAAAGIAAQAELAATNAGNTANVAVSFAQQIQRACLQIGANLSDLASASSARSNLGVASLPVLQNWDGQPAAGQVRYIPLARSYTVPASFAGSTIHCGTYATVDAPFVISYIRSGTSYTIGTLTLVHGGNFTHATPQPAATLQQGDVLTITAPNPQDPTLADVALNLVLTLV